MGPAHTSSSPPRTKSTSPALRHARDSIQSPHVRLDDTSINPGLTDLRDIGDASEELSVLDLPDENQSIAPRASPGTRDGGRPPQVPPKPSSNPRTSIPGQGPENTVPHPPQPDPHWSLSNLTDISASIPPVRSDPLTDRAVTAAGKCYNHATTILERLHQCEPLLQVADSIKSCVKLTEVVSLLLRSLHIPSEDARHDCAPQGLCPHEIWHEDHGKKLKELIERLDGFLTDFDLKHFKPLEMAPLAEKLAGHIKNVDKCEKRIQRSWLRLAVRIIDAKLQSFQPVISEAERNLVNLRHNLSAHEKRHKDLVQKFYDSQDLS